MSQVKTFFRFCPSCGKRFQIRLQSKKMIDDRVEQTETTQDVGAFGLSSGGPMFARGQPIVVEEKVPLTIDVEEFEYTYKCKHCGHVWSEMHDEQHRLESSGGRSK